MMKKKPKTRTARILVEKKTERLFRKILSILEPRPPMTISQWAVNYRVLSSEASAEPGRYKLDRACYQKEILDAVSDPNIQEIVLMTSAQVGKTEILLNILGYFIDYEPSPILYVLPTKEIAEPFSKDRLAPMLRDTPIFRDKIKGIKSRDGNNTILYKKFPGGQLNIIGANSPADLSSRPIKIILADELDRFPVSAGKEGDPFELAKRRTDTFRNRKIIAVSTPTIKGASKIEQEYETSTMEQWCVPCPACGTFQPLMFPKLIFPDDHNPKPTMRCDACDERFTEIEWKSQFPFGRWIKRKESSKRGFHLNSLSSPWRTWDEIIDDFKKAKTKGEDVFKTWINTALGESWEVRGDGTDSDNLLDRRENYLAELPKGVLLLTAGIDVQDNRLELEVVGWGRDYESWGICYKKIFGDLSKKEVWNQLDDFLDSSFSFSDGTQLNIASACIDTGGHFTDEVYRYIKRTRNKRIYGIKGKGGDGLPFIHSISKNNKEKIPLYILGVNAGKESLLARLKQSESGYGYCHFPKQVDRGYDFTYFQGLTAEHRVIRMVKGVPKQEWVIKKGCRNEPFDIRNYATAALEIISPINYTALESQLEKGINYVKRTVSSKKRTAGVVSKGVSL